nr:HetP family heterocyst commitment protein [Stanieria cyanosphaera]
MNQEQLEQLISAIVAGKYSWACVLMLRFYGRNPLDYIPYRTYYRLIKNNNFAYTLLASEKNS